MNVEPKLRRESPAKRVGCVTLTPEQVAQIAQLLPEDPLKHALQQTVQEAKARAQELNGLDRSGLPSREE